MKKKRVILNKKITKPEVDTSPVSNFTEVSTNPESISEPPINIPVIDSDKLSGEADDFVKGADYQSSVNAEKRKPWETAYDDPSYDPLELEQVFTLKLEKEYNLKLEWIFQTIKEIKKKEPRKKDQKVYKQTMVRQWISDIIDIEIKKLTK